MRAFSDKLKTQTIVYFSGGVTAVLHDLRSSTIDIDMIFEPDTHAGYQAIHDLKEDLNMNLEIAAPHHFIPEIPQWRERRLLIEQHRAVAFYHYDLHSQIIAKIQRGYDQDLADARGLLTLIREPEVLIELLTSIREDFIRFPTLEFDALKTKVETFLHA